MSLRRDGRHGLRIARAEFRRSVRNYSRSRRRLVGLAVAVLFFGGNLVVALPSAYVLGRAARDGGGIPFFGPAATAIPVGLVALAAFRTLERIGRIDAEELLLLTVHPRAVVLGLVGAEVARLTAWFGLPAGAVVAAFALGLGAPSVLLTAALVAVPVVACAAVWGYALGVTALDLLRRLPNLRRALQVVGVVAMLGVVVASQFVGRYLAAAGTPSAAGIVPGSGLAFDPVVDYAALALVGTPLARPGAVSLPALATLGAALALTPVGLAVATRRASRLWFTDAASSTSTPPGQADDAAPGGWFAVPRPFAWRPAGRVAWAQLRRARRRPQELAHLVVVVFLIGPLGTTVAESSGDALGPLLAGAGVGLGAYLAGATFGLNPLGDDRPHLPVLLLGAWPPRTLVRGRVLAGLAVGLPVATVAPLATVALGTAPARAVAFAVTGVWMCAAAAPVAVGLGALYPVYEEREFWGTETVVPSTLVTVGYLFAVGGGAAVGLVVTWYALAAGLLVAPAFVAVAVPVLALIAGASYASYRYAVRRYRRYTVD
jgi:hypothetical protein